MAQYLLILASAFALAATGTPWIRKLAFKLNIVDKPNPRKIHAHPVPLLGGAVIYLAFIVTLLILGNRQYVREVVGIFIGATLCSFMGLWDDRRGLSALIKLAGQCLAALILVLSGVQVRVLPLEVLNIAVSVLWVVGITNAMNLLDNMDGLSGGIAAAAAIFFLLMAAMSDQYLVGALAAALLGAAIGFLAYNLNPASIFMGDTGSLFIGFLLAAVGIKLRFPDNVHFVTWMVPILVLGLPIFDTTLVFIARLRRGVNPLTTPGKDHVSHRLVSLGYTQREAVLILYLVAGILGVVAVFVTQASVLEGYIVGAVVAVTGLYLLYRLLQVPPLPTGSPAPPEATSAAMLPKQ